ncbi:MAG: SusC/RagA family TonB-linked outer membrane protein [Flavobacterium sp.]|uniref:SusC/RagA family TonB-linked outer membrane protein n=1 Tax=Flavobacterium sp. TaxID=239 RepID=UPI003BBF1104
MKKPLLFFLLIFTSIVYSQGDPKKVSGKVVDDKGIPIPNVTVTFEDKDSFTDLDGKYTIEVKNSKSILRFSYLGFAPQIVVVGKNKEINITLLEEKNQLDEVVVIGYGTQKRSNVTGAISKYKNEKLDEIAVSRLDQALQGKIAGVQVQNISSEAGADAQITVRGISSINAGANPLVVVDGQPIPDGLGTINMADVASVEVLKDAASAAIYGSRGASGVILITTKSGKADKTRYSFKYSTGFKSAYQKYDLLSTSEYTELLYREQAIRNTDPAIQAEGLINPNALNIFYQGSPTKVNNLLAAYIVEQTMLGGKGYNYQDEVLRTAEFKNIQFSATGGTKSLKYYISGGYQGDEGIMLKSNFQKLNFRTKFDIDLSKRVKLSVNINPSYTTKESPSENLTNFWRYPTWLPYEHNDLTAAFVNQNPQWVSIQPGDYAHPRHFIGLTYTGTYPDGSQLILPDGTTFTPATGSPSNSAQNNPMASLLSHDINAKSYGLQSGAILNVNLFPGLDFKTMNTLYMKYDTKLDWTDRNADGDGIVNKGIYYDNTYLDLLTENTLNYKKEFENNSLELLAGFTAQQTKSTNTQTTGLDYPSDNITTLNNALFIDKSGTFGSKNQVGLLSYLGRINYAYKSKYLLSASYRTDGSSYFGPGRKWGSFPAASIGWVVNKESFLDKVDWLNKLAFRASYGVSGNNRILNYGFQNLLSSANYSFGPGTGTQSGGQVENPNINANEDITWERTYQTNFGLDVALWNNRFSLSVDVYNSVTDKLLLQQATMAFSGVPLSWNNIGSLYNKGYEFELAATILKSNNFKWSTSSNLSHTQNRIKELGNEAYLLNYGERNEIYKSVVGGPLVQFFGYKTDGIWISQAQIDASGLTSDLPSVFKPGGLRLVDVDGNGIIDTNDRTIIGDPYPDFTWGFTNNFTFKAFDFSFTWQGVQGGELINGDPNYGETKSRNANYNSNRWISPANPGDGRTPYEEIGFNWMLTDYVVEDASYFALREVNLGYTLPVSLAKKIGLSSLRLYSSAQNVYFRSASGYRGINSEGRSTSGPYSSALVAGYQRGAFPIAKTIVFGIDINF